MRRVLLISGSPSATSRTGRLLGHVAELLDGALSVLHLRDLPAEPLLPGLADHPDLVAGGIGDRPGRHPPGRRRSARASAGHGSG